MRGLLRPLVVTVLVAVVAAAGAGQTISSAEEAQTLLEEGEELQRAGDFGEAINFFGTVASDYPEARAACAWALLRTAECLKGQGDAAAAFEALQGLLAEYADVPSACALAQCKVGEHWTANVQLARAESQLRLVRANYPGQTEAVLWADLALSRCLSDQGRSSEALAAADRVLQAHPGDALPVQAAWAAFTKGSILQKLKRPDEAAAVLADAAEEFGTVDREFLRQCLLKLGEAQADDKSADWHDAAATLQWFLAEFPGAHRECAFAQYKLASLVREHGDASDAISEYTRVWTGYPDQTEPAMNAIRDVVDMHYRAARYAEAQDLLEQGIAAYEDETADVSKARLQLIECLWVQREFDAVVPVAEALVATERPGLATPKQAAEAQYRLGRAHEACGRHQEAAKAYAALVNAFEPEPALDDVVDQACFRRGNSLAAYGDVVGALQAYQQLIDRNPAEAQWRARGTFCRATVLVREGLFDQAKDELEDLRDQHPGTRFADLAEEQLRALDQEVAR